MAFSQQLSGPINILVGKIQCPVAIVDLVQNDKGHGSPEQGAMLGCGIQGRPQVPEVSIEAKAVSPFTSRALHNLESSRKRFDKPHS